MNDIGDMRYTEWLESLSENEKIQVKLLKAWVKTRENLPGLDPEGNDLIEDHKTTDEIIDELQPMYSISQDVVFYYLSFLEFGFTTDESGVVKWAIWRRPPKM